MRGAPSCALLALLLWASSARAQSGSISGVVVDRSHYEPLSGATVRIDGTDRVATTDSMGQFQFQGVPTGPHRLIWSHPELDSLGLTLASVPFVVPANDTVKVSLARPSTRALFALMCGSTTPTVLAVGRVTRLDGGEPVVGATVTATWADSAADGRTTTTDAVGRYHLCGPPAHAISIRASLGADARAYVPASPMASVRFADLRLGAAADHASATISGRVVSDSSRPVSGASIALLGTHLTATSDAAGAFSLSALPSGTQVIIARSVGMDPLIESVDLSAHAPRLVTLALQRTPPTLATVEVVASKQELTDTYDRIGFTERKKIGIGRFLTQDDIHKNAGHTVADALNGYDGIYNGSNGDHGISDADQDARDYANNSRPCTLYIVDGQILGEGEDDYGAGLPPPNQVIGVEIYRAGETKPVKVSFGADVCAEVLVWTRAELRKQ